jgi:hypothetical protein
MPRHLGLPLLVLWCAAQGLALPSAEAGTSTATSPVFTVDLQSLTGGLTVNGRVLAAATGQPLSGASVSLAGQNTSTAGDGTFSLANISLASGNTLTVSQSGFVTDTETPSIPAGSKSITLADVLLQAANGSLPVVTGLKPKYDGIFLSLASILNDYTASVNWNGHTPSSAEFYVNGVLVQTVTATGSGATATLDMASGFTGSLTAGANKVGVIAVSSDGARSAPFEQRVVVIPAPAIVSAGVGVLAPFQFLPGNDPALSFDMMFPDKDIPAEALQEIPFLGKFGWNFAVGGGFEYSLNSGEWQAHIGIQPYGRWADRQGELPHSTLADPQFFAGDRTIDFAVDGRAEGTATQTSGIVVNTVGLDLSLNYEQELLAFYLSDYVPVAQWARCLDWLKRVGVDPNSVQRVTVYGDLGAELSLEAKVNPLPIKYEDTVVSLTLGARASYEPDLKVSKGEITVGGQVTGQFQVHPSLDFQSINGQLYGKVSFTVWHWNVLDEQFVLLNYTYAASAMLSLAAASQGSNPGGATPNWVWVPVVSRPPHVTSRHYLEAGPEVFAAGGNQRGLAANGTSTLTTFRQLGQAPVKGSVMAESAASRGAFTPGIGEPDSGTNQADLTLVQNTYPGSSPAMAAWGAELMLLYVTDNGSSNDLQSTDIAWTRWDGTNWSAPLAIRTNTQSEFAPQVAYDGNGDAIAVWERVADPDFTNLDLTAMAQQMEIVWSRWVRASGTWTEPVPLTANNYLDHAPLLCGPMSDGSVLAVWTKNEANLLMGTNTPATDTVLWADWSAASQSWGAPQVLVDGLAYRLSQSLAGAGNHAVYAWTQDADGVLTNDTDQEVFFMEYTNSVWGAPQQLTTNTVADKTVRAAVATNGTVFLIWQSGTNLVLSQNFSTNLSIARADSQTAGFADYAATVGPLGHLVLLWQEMSTNGSDAHYMVYDPVAGAWGKDDLLCQDPPLERSFAPVWDNVGNLTVAYDKVQMYYTNLTLTVDGGGTVTVSNVLQSGRVDLVVTKRALVKDLALLAGDFTVQGVNYLPGDPLTLSATVHNSGNVAVSNVVVGFYDGSPDADGVLLTNVALPGWLAAATSAVASTVWVVPDPATNHTLYAAANWAGLAGEFNGSNNAASVSIGGTDLSVSLLSYSAETNGAMRVIAQVQNLGAPSATNSVLAIRPYGSTNAPLATVAVPMLEPGCLAQLALDLPAGTQPAGEQLYTLTADETHVTGDVDTNNNTSSFAVNLWIDSDGDGIPDNWMIQYFGHATGQADDLSRAQDDADGDGVSNLAEYLAGTGPKDANSYLHISSFTVGGTNGVLVVWGSATNKLYSVQRASAVGNGAVFTNLAQHLLSTPPQNSYLDTTATNSAAFFYRIRVE